MMMKNTNSSKLKLDKHLNADQLKARNEGEILACTWQFNILVWVTPMRVYVANMNTSGEKRDLYKVEF